MTSTATRNAMIERNFSAFQEIRDALATAHPGAFVVMRDGEPALFRPTAEAADREARERFPDGLFSIQRCVAGPLEQG